MAVTMKYRWRYSRRGVPHVVVKSANPRAKTGSASICYFATTNVFRVFHPWRSSIQARKDFPTLETAWAFCRELLT